VHAPVPGVEVADDAHAARVGGICEVAEPLALSGVIRTLRPRTVIIPYWEARHPDHYNASTLAYEGCFLAGLKALPLEGEPFRPFKILYCTLFADVRPTFVVDITAHFKQRRNAILGL
jgi:LmbE family N-acetylglucosaminyl deacetylase